MYYHDNIWHQEQGKTNSKGRIMISGFPSSSHIHIHVFIHLYMFLSSHTSMLLKSVFNSRVSVDLVMFSSLLVLSYSKIKNRSCIIHFASCIDYSDLNKQQASTSSWMRALPDWELLLEDHGNEVINVYVGPWVKVTVVISQDHGGWHWLVELVAGVTQPENEHEALTLPFRQPSVL